jgi:hypothetical protein
MDSGLHWHETHDEYLQVKEGSIRVQLGNKELILQAGKETRVPRFVRHEWSRANVSEGEDVVVVERTDPRDEEKQLFFWNLNGVILTAETAGVIDELLTTVRLFFIFHTLDNFPVFVNLSTFRKYVSGTWLACIESVVTHVVLGLAAILGKTIGYTAIDQRFTPLFLIQVWREDRDLNRSSLILHGSYGQKDEAGSARTTDLLDIHETLESDALPLRYSSKT